MLTIFIHNAAVITKFLLKAIRLKWFYIEDGICLAVLSFISAAGTVELELRIMNH